MTPRWARIVQLVESRLDDFEITLVNGGFRLVKQRTSLTKTRKAIEMLHVMGVQSITLLQVAEIDPIQTISPSLRMLWAGRGYRVAEMGVITVEPSPRRYVQYPFVEID